MFLYICSFGYEVVFIPKFIKDIINQCKEELAEETLKAISKDKYGKDAAIIGEVIGNENNRVLIETAVGGQRILESPIADPVPRVC